MSFELTFSTTMLQNNITVEVNNYDHDIDEIMTMLRNAWDSNGEDMAAWTVETASTYHDHIAEAIGRLKSFDKIELLLSLCENENDEDWGPGELATCVIYLKNRPTYDARDIINAIENTSAGEGKDEVEAYTALGNAMGYDDCPSPYDDYVNWENYGRDHSMGCITLWDKVYAISE